MKRLIILAAGLLAMTVLNGTWERVMAGTVEEVKKESKEAASQIRDGVVQTGKAIAETGKEVKQSSQKSWAEIKENAVKTGAAVKESVKEVGKDIKKAFQDTKEAISEEFTGEAKDSTNR